MWGRVSPVLGLSLLYALAASATPPVDPGPSSDVLAQYKDCFDGLAWATPISGERMVRHNILTKADIGGRSLYFLYPSEYPGTFDSMTYVFGSGPPIEVPMGLQPTEQDQDFYLGLKHHYFNLKIPGMPKPIVGDLAVSRAWTGTDAYLKTFEDGTAEADKFRSEHSTLPAKPIAAKVAKGESGSAALKSELVSALNEVAKTALSKLEKEKPDYFAEHPDRHSIFDRFTKALSSCSSIGDPDVQTAVTNAQSRVAAELALYMAKYPPRPPSTFERFCRALGKLF